MSYIIIRVMEYLESRLTPNRGVWLDRRLGAEGYYCESSGHTPVKRLTSYGTLYYCKHCGKELN